MASKNGTNGSTTSEAKSATKPKKKVSVYSPGTNGESLQETIDAKYLLEILTKVKNGNFNVRMPIDQTGLNGKICDTLNDIISLNNKMMQEFKFLRMPVTVSYLDNVILRKL